MALRDELELLDRVVQEEFASRNATRSPDVLIRRASVVLGDDFEDGNTECPQ